jgi:hypothetical protein
MLTHCPQSSDISANLQITNVQLHTSVTFISLKKRAIHASLWKKIILIQITILQHKCSFSDMENNKVRKEKM